MIDEWAGRKTLIYHIGKGNAITALAKTKHNMHSHRAAHGTATAQA